MQIITVIILCAAVSVAYVIYCTLLTQAGRRVKRAHRAVSTALSPGPRIREMTATKRSSPNPFKQTPIATAGCVLPSTPADAFEHVPTDYGTYTPTDISMALSPIPERE